MTSSDDPHPADRLIHDLIAQPRTATEQEIRLITDRIASAPFSPDIQDVPVRDRGRSYLGITLGIQADSLTYHLFRRTVEEKQWAMGTNGGSIRAEPSSGGSRSAGASRALPAVGDAGRRGGNCATNRTLDSQQIGERALPNLLIVYLADRGILLSGYQFSALDKVRIPKDALWLK